MAYFTFLPVVDNPKNSEQSIEQIRDYLIRLQEQLEFILEGIEGRIEK